MHTKVNRNNQTYINAYAIDFAPPQMQANAITSYHYQSKPLLINYITDYQNTTDKKQICFYNPCFWCILDFHRSSSIHQMSLTGLYRQPYCWKSLQNTLIIYALDLVIFYHILVEMEHLSKLFHHENYWALLKHITLWLTTSI